MEQEGHTRRARSAVRRQTLQNVWPHCDREAGMFMGEEPQISHDRDRMKLLTLAGGDNGAMGSSSSSAPR